MFGVYVFLDKRSMPEWLFGRSPFSKPKPRLSQTQRQERKIIQFLAAAISIGSVGRGHLSTMIQQKKSRLKAGIFCREAGIVKFKCELVAGRGFEPLTFGL